MQDVATRVFPLYAPDNASNTEPHYEEFREKFKTRASTLHRAGRYIYADENYSDVGGGHMLAGTLYILPGLI